MDIKEQEKTFDSFVSGFMWSAAAIIVVLLILGAVFV